MAGPDETTPVVAPPGAEDVAAEDAASERPGSSSSTRISGDRVTLLIGVAGLVAYLVRMGWVLWVGDRPPASIFIDPARYLGYAESIAHGDGYVENLTGQPTAYYPPGYPYFLGLLRLVHRALPGDGSFPFFVAIVQALIGAALAPLGGYVARRVVSPVAGVVAALVLALYPNLVFHTAAVLGETLYNTLFMAFLALAVRWSWPAAVTPRRAAVAAVPFALAVLVRPISLVVLPALVLRWWLSSRDLRRTALATAAVVGVLALAVVPWTVRNAVRMDAFVPMSTNTGDNLCIGHNDAANGGFVVCPGPDGVQNGTASEVRNDDDKTADALRWIRGNLGREPRLTWLRFRVMFLDDGDHDALDAIQSYPNPALGTEAWMAPTTERRLTRVADAAYVAVALVGLLGCVRLVTRGRGPGLLVVLAAAGTAAVPLLFFGDPRFKVPVMPLLCIAAAAAVTWPWAAREPEPAGAVARPDSDHVAPAVRRP